MEPSKPSLIYDAREPNAHCKYVPFMMDTVGAVAGSAWPGCFKGSLDDKSGYRHVMFLPDSWQLFGVAWENMDNMRTVLPFGWEESPFAYHTISSVRSQFLRSRGIPAATYIEGSV